MFVKINTGLIIPTASIVKIDVHPFDSTLKGHKLTIYWRDSTWIPIKSEDVHLKDHNAINDAFSKINCGEFFSFSSM